MTLWCNVFVKGINMAKFLYLQDFHISGKNFAHYIGDYFSDCLEMLEEIIQLGHEHKVDMILDGGDLFHVHSPSYRVLDEVADRVERAEISFNCLFGNHAERYHSIEHSQHTGLAHLFKRSKYFGYVDWIDDHKEEMRAEGYEFKFVEYHHNVEENILKDGIMFEESDAWKIAIVHAFICSKKFPYATHAVAKDIKTNADVVLVAHYHAEWEEQVGSTLFKDIGCLGRRSITERDITPKVLLIDTDKREITEIPLKSAKEAEEIFDLTKIEEIKKSDADIDRFIQSLESTEFQGMDLKSTIQNIAKGNNFTKEPVDLLVKKIGEYNG